MARKLTDEDTARGRRLAEIREALGLTQDAMVARLNAAAEGLGLSVRYKYYTVSRMESGSISFEDAAVWLSIDPSRKPGQPWRWDWFVFGEKRPAIAREPRETPVARPARPTGRRVAGGGR